jgi:methylenetetrahydrofolate--tRNA-(uracil-5-)-methyltransferase
MVLVIGAGLAGTEAAWQIASAGLPVHLVEMRPVRRSPAHPSAEFAELVCSNSFGALSSDRAAGLLQEELRGLGSLVIRTADAHAVPAGGALAVDRGRYSAALTAALEQHPLVTVERREHTELPGPGQIAVLATGPLTSEPLAEQLRAFTGRADCHFFDAASPIVEGESIDLSVAFRASRYDKGDADYTFVLGDPTEVIFSTAFTAARTFTLPSKTSDTLCGGIVVKVITSGAVNGANTLIIKEGANTLYTETADKRAITYTYRRNLWVMTGYETLP